MNYDKTVNQILNDLIKSEIKVESANYFIHKMFAPKAKVGYFPPLTMGMVHGIIDNIQDTTLN